LEKVFFLFEEGEGGSGAEGTEDGPAAEEESSSIFMVSSLRRCEQTILTDEYNVSVSSQ
jgi:hypothetical protein